MKKTLWIGLGGSSIAWYRCAIPATQLGQDWIGLLVGPPDDGGVMISGNHAGMPDVDNYEVIIVQLGKGDAWVKAVKRWKKLGKTVYYECDDFLQGVNRIKDHRFKSNFSKNEVKKYTSVMKECDGIICSTEFLAEQYKKYNDNVHVCLNSINTKLYDVLPHEKENDKLIIGWSGGTGHLQSFKSWYPQLLNIMRDYSNTNFVSIGTDYAIEVDKGFPSRTLSMPWTNIENYPYALKAMDIGLAPSHDSKYFRSKSDLRWVEGSAAGIPMIVNPITYPEVVDGVTGMVAATAAEFEDKLGTLVTDASLRNEIAQNAKVFVQENRDIRQGAIQWEKFLS